MKRKRFIIKKDGDHNPWFGTFSVCPNCDTEIAWQCNKRKRTKYICPVCGTKLGDFLGLDYFIDISDSNSWQYYYYELNKQTMEYSFKKKDDEFCIPDSVSSINSDYDIYGFVDNEYWRYAEARFNRFFELMHSVIEAHKYTFPAEKKADKFIEDCESMSIAEDQPRPIAINNDPDKLRDYMSHLITIETDVYSLQKRLTELYKNRIQTEDSIRFRSALEIKEIQDSLREKQNELRTALSKEENSLNRIRTGYFIKKRDVNMTWGKNPPKQPERPNKPHFQEAGFFNRRRVEEENNKLKAEYEEAQKQYRIEYDKYLEELEEYKNEKSRFESRVAEEKALAEKEYREKLNAAEEPIKKRMSELQTKIEDISSEMNKDLSRSQSTISKTAETDLIDEEIHKAEETLRDLIKAKNQLYSLNVVFGKYRNIVALASFYEYLLSGRCEKLEGANGAYNIYEGEIRANQIIAQLSDVLNSLESIKNNQYMIYSQLKTVNNSLSSLGYKMESAINSISAIEQSVNDTSASMERLASNSAVIAYNTEQTAFYAKKNKELTDALGYLVAFNTLN